MPTFAELGIPFPLFEGPSKEASEYVGLEQCALCGTANRHCFELGIGGRLIVPCRACGTENGLDTADKVDGKCRSCGIPISFPAVPTVADTGIVEKIQVCYSCFRNGKATVTHDTEFGMVTWEFAIQGTTHGVPGLKTEEFERVLIDPNDDWYGVRVSEEELLELVRTPTFLTWQGSCWLFCCKKLMIYIGELQSIKKNGLARSNPDRFFDQLLETDSNREIAIECATNGIGCVYFFRCQSCNKLRAYCDND